MNGSGHVAYKTEHTTYQIPHVTHKFAHNINESKHMTYTIAHIVDGFGHSANIFGCNMNINIWHIEFTFSHGMVLQIGTPYYTDQPTLTHSEWDSSNCPNLESGPRVRKSEKIAPISTSFIHVIIEKISKKIAPLSNLTQLPHLRLAGLYQ